MREPFRMNDARKLYERHDGALIDIAARGIARAVILQARSRSGRTGRLPGRADSRIAAYAAAAAPTHRSRRRADAGSRCGAPRDAAGSAGRPAVASSLW